MKYFCCWGNKPLFYNQQRLHPVKNSLLINNLENLLRPSFAFRLHANYIDFEINVSDAAETQR